MKKCTNEQKRGIPTDPDVTYICKKELSLLHIITSKTWFYNLPAAKATQFQGTRHLIVGASYLIQELDQKEVNNNCY